MRNRSQPSQSTPLSRGDRLANRRLPLAVDASVFPGLAKQTLSEIEPLMRFGQLLLDILDTTFERLEPRTDLGRCRSWERGTQASYLDRRERNNRRDRYEWAKKSGVHVAFLVQVRDSHVRPQSSVAAADLERSGAGWGQRPGPSRL